jgi:hypothetical protein
VRTLEEIQRQIDAASERRGELRRLLSHGRDSAIVDEVHQLDEQLSQLWDEHRALKARLRWGDRETIVARARAEERLERHEGLARAA